MIWTLFKCVPYHNTNLPSWPLWTRWRAGLSPLQGQPPTGDVSLCLDSSILMTRPPSTRYTVPAIWWTMIVVISLFFHYFDISDKTRFRYDNQHTIMIDYHCFYGCTFFYDKTRIANHLTEFLIACSLRKVTHMFPLLWSSSTLSLPLRKS